MWGGLCPQHQLEWSRGLIRGSHSWLINSSVDSRQAIPADAPAEPQQLCAASSPHPLQLMNVVLAVTTHRGHRDWRLLKTQGLEKPPSQSFCSQNQQSKWHWESGNHFGGRGFTLSLQRWFIKNCSNSSHSLLMGFNCSVLKLFQTLKSEQGTHSH